MYKIIIGDFAVGETIYHNRCQCAGIGEKVIGIDSETIPWITEEKTYNPWDVKYENNQFIIDEIYIPTPTPTPSDMDKLTAQMLYTATMTDTLLGE